METKTCKTCMFWSGEALFGNPDRFTQRECTHDKLREYYFADAADDDLVYPYQEGGSFYTGPNFGCVHHVKKEPSDG